MPDVGGEAVEVVRKLSTLLTSQERRQALLLVPVMIAIALAELGGVASIAPFLAAVAEPERSASAGILGWLDSVLGSPGPTTFLIVLGGLTLLVLIAANATLALGYRALFSFGAACRHGISERLLSSHLRQPYAFYLGRNTSDLAGEVLHESEVVAKRVIVPGLLALAKAVAALAIVCYLIALQPRVGLLIGAMLGGAYALIFRLTRLHLLRMGRERSVANQQRFLAATAALGGVKDLKVLGRETDAVRRFRGPSQRHAVLDANQEVLVRLPRFALEAVALAGMILVVLGFVVIGGSSGQVMPLLGVYAFGGYRTLLALYDVFQGMSDVRYGTGALDTVADAIIASAEGDDSHSGDFGSNDDVQVMPLRKALRVEKVTFRYPGAVEEALRGVDMSMHARAAIALLGASGSGKSTLVDLIVGLLSPDRGAIVVDGVRLAAAHLRGWQKTLGYVPQHAFLADDTVAQNIALGVPARAIDHHAVRRAARLAQIANVIEHDLPHGYDTVIGERGARLSGGQRQRVAIARALYHRPALIVFDEATSSLDAETERDLLNGVRSSEGQPTLLAVTHRVSAVRDFDQLIVLDRGRAVATGRYEDLIATSREFQQLAAELDATA